MSFPPSKILKSNTKTLTLLTQPLTLTQTTQLHSHLVTTAAISDPFTAAKLITLATNPSLKTPNLHYPHLIFTHLPFPPSTFIHNAIIKSHTERNEPISALSFYRHMLINGHSMPNNYTFSFLLTSCVKIQYLVMGRTLHSQIVRLGWESYDFVLNGLVHLYISCDSIDCARRLFDRSLNRDVITWTAMVNGYAKLGQIGLAREMFDRMPERNAVTWSTMITTYAQVGMFIEAMEVFVEMQVAGVLPNHAGIVGCLSACGFLGALDQGRWIHAYAKRNRMELDRILGTALIDMYAKCGCIENAMQVFEEMTERDVFAYTSMISGFSNHGKCEKAMELFVRMEKDGVRPNEVTLICLLTACGRIGLVDQGHELFNKMSRAYGIEPGVEHYGCLVDLLGRAGFVQEANTVVKEMPMKPDSYVLGALLNACREHGEVELAKETAERLEEIGLDHSGVHVLLSNVYAEACKWEDVMIVRKEMEAKQVKKVPGCSLVEVDGVSCEFVAGDKSHEKMEELVSALKLMDEQIKCLGDEVLCRLK